MITHTLRRALYAFSLLTNVQNRGCMFHCCAGKDCINLRWFMLASGIANLPCCPPFGTINCDIYYSSRNIASSPIVASH